MTKASPHAKLNSFTTEPMDTYDFAELESEVFDWQDDMLIPADDDTEAERNFSQLFTTNIDY